MVVSPLLVETLAVGLVALFALVKAAQLAVDRSVALAQHYDVPDVLIGVTVIAVGTSLPEIGSHVIASLGILSGTLDYTVASATVLGGNMGSSTAQQTLLFGLFLLGFGRIELSTSFLRGTYVPMVLALVLTLGLGWDGVFSRPDGAVLVVAFAVYLYVSVTRRQRSVNLEAAASTNVARDVVFVCGGLLVVLASAFLVLSVVQRLVDSLALGGSMIGVFTIGLAAALPELSTVTESIRRRAPNIALGTLVGSNVVNPLVGIGLGASISTYSVPASVVLWDLPFKLAVAVGLLGYVLYGPSRTLRRREGFYLVVAYFVFVSVRVLLFAEQ